MKTVAIIGADSMIGSELARQLRKRVSSVISVGRSAHNDIVFDLTGVFDPDSCKGLQADILIHCASSFGGDDPAGARINFSTNTLGCLNVLSLMQTLSCKNVCYAGTVTSNDNFDPGRMNSYGLSKAQAENILEWGMSRVGGCFCSLRLTGVYDTEGKSRKHQPWFGRIVAYASRGMDLRMPASEGGRNYLHVIDAAGLMIRALEAELSGCWHMCNNEQMDHAAIAELAYAEFNCGGEVLLDRNKHPFRCVNYPSSADLYERLGVAPAISIAKGMEMIHRAATAANFGPMDVQ
jgi:nucleoside-diphosphate-sugar epimerase